MAWYSRLCSKRNKGYSWSQQDSFLGIWSRIPWEIPRVWSVVWHVDWDELLEGNQSRTHSQIPQPDPPRAGPNHLGHLRPLPIGLPWANGGWNARSPSNHQHWEPVPQDSTTEWETDIWFHFPNIYFQEMFVPAWGEVFMEFKDARGPSGLIGSPEQQD
jgi:hypothetical protein